MLFTLPEDMRPLNTVYGIVVNGTSKAIYMAIVLPNGNVLLQDLVGNIYKPTSGDINGYFVFTP